ncbi:cytoplasmic protein [Scheffersomyces coipomensis]|uniref:cytoplasmic protein n=1 Tax=Scheffersomyces coipomensis TaxID=1788519 RepID=UPI00315D9885
MEKFGFHKVSNANANPGQPTISHSRPNVDTRAITSQHQQQPTNYKRQFIVEQCPNNAIALSNCIGVHPDDFNQFANHSPILLDGHYVVTIEKSELSKPGTIGLAGDSRKWGKWSLGQTVQVESYNIFQNKSANQYLGAVELLVDFRSKAKAKSMNISHDELVEAFKYICENQILQPTQPIVLDFQGSVLQLLVNNVQVVDVNKDDNLPTIKESIDLSTKGILLRQTDVIFYPNEKSLINLVKPASILGLKFGTSPHHRPKPRKQIINPDFKLEDLGIGGLDNEFQDIFRRAFNSRILPPEIAEKLEIKHCKGLLLFGPPGTGKTLIARKLSKMLNGRDPKIVNGPEMLSKYVGESENNIRKLFKEAEDEFKQKGDDSDLHVIIFDELDSVFKQRGSARSDGTGVGDNVVNQLLSKMDGVDQLNNILVIGMTNRLDLIDSALLRPGRFEIQIEISLPDEKGRRDIFLIHTAKLRENKILTSDVDFDELSTLSKNFTGAEIEGLCNSAKSFAISRHTKSGALAKIDEKTINEMKITRNDFLLALNEIKPAFGTDEEDLNLAARHGIIQFNESITNIFDKGRSIVDLVKNNETETLRSILLYGSSGVGKTAIASTIALGSDFPFIKMLSAESVVGRSEAQKIQYIDTVFRDVYKSPLSVLVIDKIETLINFVNIGPRFSNDILQLILVYLTKLPPKGRRLLIIGTTSEYSVLERMSLVKAFTDLIAVPSLKTVEEISKVMDKISFKSIEERKQILNAISSYEINIGVKKLIEELMVNNSSDYSVDDVVLNLVPKLTQI